MKSFHQIDFKPGHNDPYVLRFIGMTVLNNSQWFFGFIQDFLDHHVWIDVGFALSHFRCFALSLFCSLFRTFAVSHFHCSILSQFRTLVVSHFRCFTLLLFRTFAVCNFVVSQFRIFVVLLFHCVTLLLFRTIAVS